MKCVKCNNPCKDADYCSVCTLGVQGWKLDPRDHTALKVMHERRGDALERIAAESTDPKAVEMANEALWRRGFPFPTSTARRAT